MQILILATFAFFAAAGWLREIFRTQRLLSCNRACNEYIRFLKQDRDEWKKLAEDREIEGDEWKGSIK